MASQASRQGWPAAAMTLLATAVIESRVGRPDRAAAMLDQAIAQFDDSFVRDRQICLTRLADARARPGPQYDLNAAAGLGMAAIDLMDSVDSTRGTDDLHDLCRDLTPHAKVPAVRDFLDRARGFVAV